MSLVSENFIRLGDLDVNFFKGIGLNKSSFSEIGNTFGIHYGQLFTEYGPVIKQVRLKVIDFNGSLKSQVNDVLMPTSDVTPNGLAKASSVSVEGIVLGGDILVIRANTNVIYGPYLSHFIRFSPEQIKSLVSGSTVYHIYAKDLREFKLFLPEVSEQKAIAKALSDIDELISELELEIKKLEDFKLSQIYLILNPDSLIKNGIITQSYILSNIANFAKGRGQNKSNLIESGDFPCILYGELFTTYGEIIDTVVSKSSINEGLNSVSGDVLIPGSTTTVGRDLATASVIKQNGVLLGGDINIIRFNDFKTVLPDYFAYLFKYVLVDQVEQMAQGTTIKHLYGKDIIKLSIDLPPIDYQAQAIRNLSITETRISSAKSEMKKYEYIKQGMAHDLLTGKVRLV